MFAILTVCDILIIFGYFLKKEKIGKIVPWCIVCLLIIIMGLRVDVGVDYQAYKDMYIDPLSVGRIAVEPFWIYIIDYMNQNHLSYRSFFFLTSTIIVLFYFKGMKELSTNIYISLLMFIACGIYYESSNAVRQCCAQAMLFAGTVPFLRKEWTKFALYSIMAIMMHFSAIIGIIILIICQFRYRNWILWASLIVTFVNGIVLMRLFENNIMILTESTYRSESFDAGISTGTLRYAYNLFGFIILLLYPRLKDNHPNAIIFFNLTLMGICIYNVFFTFLVMKRLTYYCFPYITILLPYLGSLFTKKSKVLFYSSIIVLFSLFAMKQVFSVPYSFDVYFLKS